MSENDELGDFEEYGEDPDDSEDSTGGEEQKAVQISAEEEREQLLEENRELRTRLERLEHPELNPLDLDPRIGAKDLCFDRAKPGAKVYVVDVLAETVEDYYEEFPDSPALDEYAGNVVVRMDEEDAVFACVYVKDSLTSVDTAITAYPMPESRLTRYPAEEASMVGGASVEFERTRLPGEGEGDA